ncbi:MAG TPA: NADH-ubiquinone oxidoreductase-F iron-sulfur binding region domain-containing protein [Pseudonocardia sp.]|nr:NADH-ubiquinone oxidoreductase-F iron-sulfur binding region domain-containing protein [Pseudonocardia sp.]
MPAPRQVHPRTVAGLGKVLDMASILGLDADVGADLDRELAPEMGPSADLAASRGANGTSSRGGPDASATPSGAIPIPRTPAIPGQRRPVLSSGPLHAVRPPAPAPNGRGTPRPSTGTTPPTAPPAVQWSPSPDAPPAVPWSPSPDAPPATPWSTLQQPALAPPVPPSRRAAPAPAPAPPTPRRAAALPAAQSAPRLLAGWLATGQPAELEEHLRRYGELPRARFAGRHGAERLRELTEDAGLRGRGGAGFPTARKMAAVAGAATGRRRPVVVANGCEGDPTSAKDQLLLHAAPHLVLDGLALAAHAVGADQAIVCVPRGSALVEPLEDAVARRLEDPAQVHVVTTPRRFVASEASALVNFLTSGDARPTSSPPLPAERGVQGRPTLLDNVETLAQLALLARHDADWFRGRGTADSPGTALVTIGGAVHRPGVYEVDLGSPAGQVARLAGGVTGPAGAVLLGGLGGTWLPLEGAASVPLDYRRPGWTGPSLGLASLLVLPAEVCGLAVTSAVVGYLAGESAGQCGPCMFGLPAVAADLRALAEGTGRAELLERLRRRLGVIPGRGACGHPDGAIRLAASALEVFADDVAEHADGRPCGRRGADAVAVLRELSNTERGWR